MELEDVKVLPRKTYQDIASALASVYFAVKSGSTQEDVGTVVGRGGTMQSCAVRGSFMLAKVYLSGESFARTHPESFAIIEEIALGFHAQRSLDISISQRSGTLKALEFALDYVSNLSRLHY